MLLTNLTRGNEIGANSYLLDFDGEARVVLDSGMHPRAEGTDALPNFEPLQHKPLDAIIISHAHHDHLGSLPVLMREQSKARVFMSEPTYYLADPLLHNSVQVMLKQRDELARPEYPFFTHRELDQQAHIWQACGLNRAWSLEGHPLIDREPVSFTFHDAGHILGSVGVELNHRGRKVFYTGDVNFSDQTLVQKAQFPQSEIDTLIIETTRGTHPTPEGFSRPQQISQLAQAINETFEKGGAIMIPVFALGKTQETLALIHFLQRGKQIPAGPIYIGGLGRSLTVIYDKLAGRSQRSHGHLQLLEDIRPQVLDGKTITDFKPKKGHIYLLSSGMMTEKTLSNVLAQRFLSEERHSILFVGYCDPASPAGRLLATKRGEQVVLSKNYGEQPVLCRVEHFDLTAHAQREDLLNYILTVNPRACALVHGDLAALQWFQKELAEQRPGMKVILPPSGETITI